MSRPTATTLAPEMTPASVAELCRTLRERAWPGSHLEIGTAAGGTLCELLQAAVHQPPFIVVDPMTYFPDQRRTVARNLQRHGLDPARVEIRETESATAYERARAANERFDFILVDGSHKFRHVIADLRWANLVDVGGVLALHDYAPEMPGVVRAVDHFLRQNPNYQRLSLTDSLLLLEKTAPDTGTGVRLMSAPAASCVHVWLQWQTSWRKRFGEH